MWRWSLRVRPPPPPPLAPSRSADRRGRAAAVPRRHPAPGPRSRCAHPRAPPAAGRDGVRRPRRLLDRRRRHPQPRRGARHHPRTHRLRPVAPQLPQDPRRGPQRRGVPRRLLRLRDDRRLLRAADRAAAGWHQPAAVRPAQPDHGPGHRRHRRQRRRRRQCGARLPGRHPGRQPGHRLRGRPALRRLQGEVHRRRLRPDRPQHPAVDQEARARLPHHPRHLARCTHPGHRLHRRRARPRVLPHGPGLRRGHGLDLPEVPPAQQDGQTRGTPRRRGVRQHLPPYAGGRRPVR